MDPPYSTHLEYSGKEECIGELDAFTPAYFDAMDAVFAEAERCLRDRRYLALYCCDTFKKKRGFVGIGAALFTLLARRFEPVDHIAVVRGNRKLEKPNFHRAAAEENFFLRGFNHLLVFKKVKGAGSAAPHARSSEPAAVEGDRPPSKRAKDARRGEPDRSNARRTRRAHGESDGRAHVERDRA
jgi:hypothetical protein